MATHARYYRSVSEVVQKSTEARARDPFDDGLGNASWVGRRFADWSAAAAAAQGLWEEGVREIESMRRELTDVNLPRPRSVRRKSCWGEDGGDEVCNDRLRSGQEFWRTSRREPAAGSPRLTVVAQIGATFKVGSRELFWRGAAAVVLADLLEGAGYQVELYAAGKSKGVFGSEDYSLRTVLLKDAGTPVNVAALANALSGWFYRTVGLQEHACETRARRTGWGGTIRLGQEELEREVGPCLILQDVWDRASALGLIRRTVEGLNP